MAWIGLEIWFSRRNCILYGWNCFVAYLLRTCRAGKSVGWGREEVNTKEEMVADDLAVAVSWDIVIFQWDHYISFLGDIGFGGTRWYNGINWLDSMIWMFRTDWTYPTVWGCDIGTNYSVCRIGSTTILYWGMAGGRKRRLTPLSSPLQGERGICVNGVK